MVLGTINSRLGLRRVPTWNDFEKWFEQNLAKLKFNPLLQDTLPKTRNFSLGNRINH